MLLSAFNSERDTFRCAVGYFCGLSPASVVTKRVVETARALQSTHVLSIEYDLSFAVDPARFSSVYAAYVSLNASLSAAVYGANFTALLNLMSEYEVFSDAYAAPVNSTAVTFAPFELPPQASAVPSLGDVPLTLVRSRSRQGDSTSILWIIVAVVVGVTCCVCLFCSYRSYRDSLNHPKNETMASFAPTDTQGEVIPEEGETVDWVRILTLRSSNSYDRDFERLNEEVHPVVAIHRHRDHQFILD